MAYNIYTNTFEYKTFVRKKPDKPLKEDSSTETEQSTLLQQETKAVQNHQNKP